MDGLEFGNIRKVTAREMQKFFKSAQANDNEALAEFFAKVVTKCPPDWGKPDEAETYANLPYFGEFKGVLEAFVAEANKGKN
jgi:hypothetical protein